MGQKNNFKSLKHFKIKKYFKGVKKQTSINFFRVTILSVKKEKENLEFGQLGSEGSMNLNSKKSCSHISKLGSARLL